LESRRSDQSSQRLSADFSRQIFQKIVLGRAWKGRRGRFLQVAKAFAGNEAWVDIYLAISAVLAVVLVAAHSVMTRIDR
jgi:hypothetical protein